MISTGPSQPIRIGQRVTWDFYSRQGVHLLYNNRKPKEISKTRNNNFEIDVSVKFLPQSGDVSFRFCSNWKA